MTFRTATPIRTTLRYMLWAIGHMIVFAWEILDLLLHPNVSITEVCARTVTLRLRLAHLVIADAERHITADTTDVVTSPWITWIHNPLPEPLEAVEGDEAA